MPRDNNTINPFWVQSLADEWNEAVVVKAMIESLIGIPPTIVENKPVKIFTNCHCEPEEITRPHVLAKHVETRSCSTPKKKPNQIFFGWE